MNLSRIKVNGTRLITATDIRLPSGLTPQNYQNIRGIKLNGNTVIDFQSYNKCGPGPVTMGEATAGCTLLLASDKHSRLDMKCFGDTVENSPYIPYRGVAGIVRAALFAGLNGAHGVAVNYDLEAGGPVLSSMGLQETGTFGYPTNASLLGYPAITEEDLVSPPEQWPPEDYMTKLLFPDYYVGGYYATPDTWTGPDRLVISNFYSSTSVSANLFDGGDNYTGNIPDRPPGYSPDNDWTPILFDQSHLVAGSFGIDAWGTAPDPGGFADSLKIVTYDDARLWYTAGYNFGEGNHNFNVSHIDHIIFIGCTYEQVGAFLEGIKSVGSSTIDIDSLIANSRVYSTGFEGLTNTSAEDFINHFICIRDAMGWNTSGTPNTWTLSSNAAIIMGSSWLYNNSNVSGSIFDPVYADRSFKSLLLHAIANTTDCIGCLVSDFPSLFDYSYMGFNGKYNLLGPISPWLDPFDATAASIQSYATDWSDRLVEYCIDPAPLFDFIRDPNISDLFSYNRGVLNNNDNVCLKFYMTGDGIGNPEILTESISCGAGDWESVAGSDPSEYHVYFFQRTLNFTVNMDGIIILGTPEFPYP